MTEYSEVLRSMRAVYRSGRTRDVEWRRSQLMAMLKMFDENRDRLVDALKKDLNKSKFESCLMEIDYTRNDLVYALNNLSEWVKPEKVKKGILHLMDKTYIRREPFGVALIIGAWNYPVQLALAPVIGALAAGNCVVLKPSEISESTAALFEDLIPKYFDTECIRCINGGIPETTALLKEKWDYIFYTGNSMVGKIIMRAAAEHLTPVTLELGGKSPVYIDRDVDLSVVSNRILWGKCMNAGQTCIAPDYIMCSKETQDALIEKMKATLGNFYPDGPAKSPDYCRLINDRHYQRVKKMLGGGGKVAVGGDTDDSQRFIAPTVLSDVSFSDPIMQEEVFGPILPIVPVMNEDEAIAHINEATVGTPLTIYIFSHNQKVTQKLLNSTNTGSCCVNDTLMQGSLPTLPFGGVGNSGMGGYHGKFSFDTFSHKRGCMERTLTLESVNGMRYPPFTQKKANTAAWIMKKKLKSSGPISLVPYFIFGTLFAVLLKHPSPNLHGDLYGFSKASPILLSATLPQSPWTLSQPPCHNLHGPSLSDPATTSMDPLSATMPQSPRTLSQRPCNNLHGPSLSDPATIFTGPLSATLPQSPRTLSQPPCHNLHGPSLSDPATISMHPLSATLPHTPRTLSQQPCHNLHAPSLSDPATTSTDPLSLTLPQYPQTFSQ